MNCTFEQETLPSLMGTSVKRSPFLNFKHGRHSNHALSWVALTEVVRKIEKDLRNGGNSPTRNRQTSWVCTAI